MWLVPLSFIVVDFTPYTIKATRMNPDRKTADPRKPC